MFIQFRIPRWLLISCGIIGLFLCGIFADKFTTVSSNHVPKPIEQIGTSEKVIALTINVDWGEEYIPGILQTLEAGQAKATFFVTGRWAKKNPELLRSIIAGGHEVENHGYRHPHPDQLSIEGNLEEIKKTESIIQGIIGYKTRYYAPPYGERGVSGLKAADNLGYATILWTLDTVDWRPESTTEKIVQRVLHPAIRFGVRPDQRGAIVLMHPKKNTTEALPIIIQELKNQGYQLLTVDKLITFSQTGNTTE